MTDARGCWPLSEPMPVVLRDRDLMKVLGLKHSRYALRKKAGEFTFLLVRPQLPTVTLYSGRLVESWVRGEMGESRFFQGARRHASTVPADAGNRPRNAVAGNTLAGGVR